MKQLDRVEPVLMVRDVRRADTSWGTREFHVRDPDGNGLQFYADL